MRRILQIFFLSSLLTTFYLLLTPAADAAGEFSISYDNIYEVDENFNLNVSQNVKITNLTTQYYVSEFTIVVGNVKVENVAAVDELGPIQADVNFANNQTTIKFKFGTPVVGRGQIKNFTLNYKATELINYAGQILEVSIPKLADAEDVNLFNVTLVVPSNIGPVAFITPEPIASEIAGLGNKNKYFFDKNQLIQSGVSATFGERQIFSFTLKYHLQSPKTAKTEIAIPSNNPYQKVIIEKIDPEPLDVRQDSDGNWLASYQLDGGLQKDVQVVGFVEVYPKPKFKLENFADLKSLLQPQQYWEVNDSYFGQKASQLKTPRQIYDFVTSFLSYNQERLKAATVQRTGAAAAVKNPKNSVCMEFTDLFITLARAANIPAREINGFAVSANERLRPRSLVNLGGDILHAWPEYWDEKEKVWIQVDPTWGTTSGGLDYFSKMDFAHLAFVHKGQSSTYPVPAGGYKTDPAQSGDVKVEFAKSLPALTSNPKVSIEIDKNLFSGFLAKGEIVVKNFSNQVILQDPLVIKTQNLILKTPAEVNLGILPPYANRKIEFEIDNPGLLTNVKGEISVTFGGVTEALTVQIRPLAIPILASLAAVAIFLACVIFGSFFLFKKLVTKPS